MMAKWEYCEMVAQPEFTGSGMQVTRPGDNPKWHFVAIAYTPNVTPPQESGFWHANEQLPRVRQFRALFAKLGLDGWEAFHVEGNIGDVLTDAHAGVYTRVYFKRSKQ
jgi:hypothetical protein